MSADCHVPLFLCHSRSPALSQRFAVLDDSRVTAAPGCRPSRCRTQRVDALAPCCFPAPATVVGLELQQVRQLRKVDTFGAVTCSSARRTVNASTYSVAASSGDSTPATISRQRLRLPQFGCSADLRHPQRLACCRMAARSRSFSAPSALAAEIGKTNQPQRRRFTPAPAAAVAADVGSGGR